jgi:hypothetical protein
MRLATISRRAHVCNRKSSGSGIASSVGHTASSKSLLSSVSNAGQHGAHRKQLLATARCELGAACIVLDAPLLRCKVHSRAHGTVDAERGAGRRCVFEFAEQVLDVHGSVLDARNACSC